ncbi:hypothetical protein PANT_9c00243 [Moesziomyces antarcticus T-34]|uniref:50S ribosomal protein L35 n=1 Tax=Pseudozyma antarctica (strain T-34) TaxID=1151754 RepID=M9MEQ7_PSEA3|nr:hypothetical protein PANT_9c00243 [Moesziomyces antarcticus T-34]
MFATTSRFMAAFARPSFFALRSPLTPVGSSSLPSSFNATRMFSTSRIAEASPRKKHLAQHGSGGKLKSHTGTKKRWTPLGSGSGKAYQLDFKRGLAGKRHLNSHMSRDRLNGLGGTVLSPRGRINRTLRRLLGPSL